MKKTLTLSGLLLIIGCSSTPENPDPHSEFNHDMLELNVMLDDNLLHPVAKGYKTVLPASAQRSVANFVCNWKEPFYFVNHTLAGEGENALTNLFRFVINTTAGILGLFDIAEKIGLERAKTSHKTTLTKWKMPNGDYLVLPVFGASSTRDAIAEPISWYEDPMTYVIGPFWMFVKAVVEAVSDRAVDEETINELLKNPDIYALMKSAYEQKFGVHKDNNENIAAGAEVTIEEE